jgi:hypothetical protein
MKPSIFVKANSDELLSSVNGREPVPCFRGKLVDGTPVVIVCYRLTWWERFGILFRGKIFHLSTPKTSAISLSEPK